MMSSAFPSPSKYPRPGDEEVEVLSSRGNPEARGRLVVASAVPDTTPSLPEESTAATR